MALAVATLAICPPLGLAKTFTTFNEVELFAQNPSGNYYEEHHATSGTGLAQVYAHAALGGSVDAVVRVGASYVTNAGDILEPFSAVTSTRGTVTGNISCVNFEGGTEGSLALDLQQWRFENSAWVLKDAFPVRTWGCPVVSVVVDSFSTSAPFTFEPAGTYRVMLQILARARSTDTSQATVDFCASGTVRCGVSPENVQLQEIAVPNQAPYARFNDQSFWYVTAVEEGVRVTGRACDIDGTTVEIKMRILGFPGETTTPIGAVCGNGFHDFTPVAPGFYTGVAEGLDNEGALGRDLGECRITVFPTDPIPSGFPNLSQYQPASTFSIQSLMAEDDSVIANRVTVDGQIVSDTLSGMVPLVGSDLASISYDLQSGQASVTLDGVLNWSGVVAPAPDAVGWWDVHPV